MFFMRGNNIFLTSHNVHTHHHTTWTVKRSRTVMCLVGRQRGTMQSQTGRAKSALSRARGERTNSEAKHEQLLRVLKMFVAPHKVVHTITCSPALRASTSPLCAQLYTTSTTSSRTNVYWKQRISYYASGCYTAQQIALSLSLGRLHKLCLSNSAHIWTY